MIQMNNEINKLISDKLADIFDSYESTPDLKELSDELQSDLLASAEDKVKAGSTPEQAVDNAFDNFGDIDDLIDQINENSDKHHGSKKSYKLDIDDNGVRINDGKLLNIDDHGVSINQGKFFKADNNGVKLGKLTIDSDGIRTEDKPSKESKEDYFDNFDNQFDASVNTEVYVESLNLVNKREFSADEIDNIDVDYSQVKLTILPSKTDKIVLREYMSRDNDKYYAQIGVVDDDLTIKNGAYPKFLPLRVRVQLLLPKEFIGRLRLLNYSGNIVMSGITGLEGVKATLHSGSFKAENIEVDNLAVKAKSGSVRLNNVKATDLLKMNVHSGSIKFDKLFSNEIDLDAHSGSIHGHAFNGAGKINLHSGSLVMSVHELTDDVNISSKSGLVKLDTSLLDNFKFDLSAKSGTVKVPSFAVLDHDVQSYKDGSIGSDPLHSIIVKAASGAINMK
ncbi:DUF4097 domain-containing protein [Lactobacillus salsicarnum]|uniref:DUF4097 domain-containing protein n=2 Tax=Companilactobacillus mishanensis TaxID=2486008 RepID=A0ABW9P4D5_9LACO|nr:DUF4097 domain-containing protein [Companilactobacillus mishanensis]